ncbi:ABC transporter permease [Nocardia mexicana]|uniref:Putative ABC transport system permease protein n=1 Tax=Nocardia mexicana TaxID=279262 RepID=A0A370GHX1_9NOCA|nr:ABC transporter permease [Nocardia mexicana]RDI42789.1 putative ABC transport system permease protein [Nocardia mexicana]
MPSPTPVRARLDRWRVFSVRELLLHPGRTVAAVLVMAVSASFLVAVLAISGSLSGTVRQLADSVAGDAALEVSGITASGFDARLAEDVAAVPGVAAAVPMIRAQATTDSGPAMLIGTDASAAQLDSALRDAVDRQLAALVSAPNSVLTGPALNHPQGTSIRVGDGRVTVAGALAGASAGRINDGHYVLAPLPLAQRLTGRTGHLDAVLVTLRPGADPAAVRAGVTDVVAGRAVVGDPLQRTAQTGNGIRIVQYMTLMGATVAFVVAAFLIYTVMTMAVSRRRATLSMLRAIGGRRTTLVSNLLAESAVLGLIGGLLGAGLGVAMGMVAVSSLPTVLLQAVQARLEFFLPWYAVPLAVLASVATTTAAAAMAAHQIYKVSPVEALAPAEAASTTGIPRWLRFAGLAGAGALVAVAYAIRAVRPGELVASAAAFALFFGAGMALCLGLTEPIIAATAAVARLFRAPGELAATTVHRSRIRVWATLMTVFMAVAMTVTITGANRDLLTAARDSLAPLGQADLVVSTNPPGELPLGPRLPDSLAGQLARAPGVERVVEGQTAFAGIGDVKVLLVGLGAGTSDPLYHVVSEQVRSDLLAGRGVVLSRDLGTALHVGAGDVLPLQTPTGVRPVRVLELVSYLSVLTGTIGMDIGQMRSWFDLPGSTTMQIDAVPGTDPGALERAVRAAAPPDAHVYTGAQALEGVQGSVRQGGAVANALWVIVVLISAVALLNTLTLSVLERRREIGVLRAIGTTRRFALRMVLAEAAGIGLIGGLIGLGFGVAAQYFYDSVTPGILHFDVPYRPGPSAIGFAAAALLLSLLGSIPPAVRAGRIAIIEAIEVG